MPRDDLRSLARFHGIAMEYLDNYGVRRRTSLATLEALLTTMGVPCGTPGEIQASLHRHRERLSNRLLPPVTVATPGRGHTLRVNMWWPRPEVPSPVDLEGELLNEHGKKDRWLPDSGRLQLMDTQEGVDGCRLALSLPLPAGLAEGYYDLTLRVKGAGRAETATTRLVVSPGKAYVPPLLDQGARLWGLNLPLYALRSHHNWGIGDFSDLRQATVWAGELGAAFVGVNPLHAPQPCIDADPSPYSPTSRLFLNFLYINPDSVPEMQESPEAQNLLASPEFQADLTSLRDAPLVVYPEVRRLKRRVLELLFAAFVKRHGLPETPRTPRGQEFSLFVTQAGESLRKFSLFQALADVQGRSNWHRWPEALHGPDTPEVAAFALEHARDLRFHQYVQWLAAQQRQAVWEEARRAVLPFSLYQDLALGASPGGFETWGYPDLFARGAAMGAPPDAFNPRGQNWGLPPLIPRNLEESGYHLFIDTLRANLPPGGILRMDHVMGLFRLFWIPQGHGIGAYVRYPARDFLGLLTLESHRRQTLIIGEDLGTVAPLTRRKLAQARIFSYRVFFFEREQGNHFKAPGNYPRQAIATATTHDLPTLAGYWEGRDLDLRESLDLYPSPQMAAVDAASRVADRQLLMEALKQQGLVPPHCSSSLKQCPVEARQGVLKYLGESQAALLEVRLEDILGLTAQQNLPGTTYQHPNWRQKIPPALEEMRQNPEVQSLAAKLRQARRQETRKT